jgi:hypothetical protein
MVKIDSLNTCNSFFDAGFAGVPARPNQAWTEALGRGFT